MSDDPVVSVIVPCYNGSAHLDSCVRSVFDQQIPVEVIIVDDGSTDDSLAKARALMGAHPGSMLVVTQVNQGPGHARNTGLRLARGKYVCFLDVDDEYAPGFFSAAIQVLASDASVVGVYCGIELIDVHRPVEPWHIELTEDNLTGNLIMRADAARQMGGYPVDGAFRGKAAGEDCVFRYELQRFGKIVKLPRPLFRHRVRPGGRFDFFLDRAVRVNGQVLLKESTQQERDGACNVPCKPTASRSNLA